MPRLAPALLLLTALPLPAAAGEIGCWFEKGAVVVPAKAAGVAGDFILDTAAPQTLLHETRAQGEGLDETGTSGPVSLAGVSVGPVAVGVADLDARTYAFTTPIAGVIGADVLGRFVVDIEFAPCRVTLSRPGAAPRLKGRRGKTLQMIDGAATGLAFDGARSRTAPFRLSTGGDLPLRLDEAQARVPGAAKPEELYPEGVWRARLASLSFAGQAYEHVETGLLHAGGAGGALGIIGTPILARYRLRFDFPRGRLTLVSAPRSARPGGS